MPPLLIRHCNSRDTETVRQTDSETMGNRRNVIQDRQTHKGRLSNRQNRDPQIQIQKGGREGQGGTHRHTQREREGDTATDIYIYTR